MSGKVGKTQLNHMVQLYNALESMEDLESFRDLDFAEIEKRILAAYGQDAHGSLMRDTLTGRKAMSYVLDDIGYITPKDYFLGEDPEERTGSERDGPKKLYWTQPIPNAGTKGETPPSVSKRAKLRAKRKQRNKR